MVATQFAFEAIGTQWTIDLDIPATIDPKKVLQAIEDRIERFDQAYSRFRADSLVTQMAATAGTYELSSDAPPLLDLYRQLYDLTGGLFTPLIGRTLEEAGYDAQYSLKPQTLQTPPPWEDVLTVSPGSIVLAQPALLDFGAAGKGYLLDLVGQVLVQLGVSTFCLDAGGDIVVHSTSAEPLRVGLEHPLNQQQVIGVAHVHNQSLCASAGNRRAWDAYHHILDPHTLTSPDKILATWVIAPEGIVADALATCLFLVPPATLLPHFTFDFLVMYTDTSIERSPNFPAELFTRNS